MENKTKEIYFEWCIKCIHKKNPEYETPCDECLQVFHRPDSHKPLYFEQKEEVTKNG